MHHFRGRLASPAARNWDVVFGGAAPDVGVIVLPMSSLLRLNLRMRV